MRYNASSDECQIGLFRYRGTRVTKGWKPFASPTVKQPPLFDGLMTTPVCYESSFCDVDTRERIVVFSVPDYRYSLLQSTSNAEFPPKASVFRFFIRASTLLELMKLAR